MKIAIATFNTDNRNLAGIVTAPIMLQQTLNAHTDVFADIVATHPKGKFDIDEGIMYPEDEQHMSEFLNSYDFIIFATPGFLIKKVDEDKKGHMYDAFMNGLTTPFAVVINEERDWQLYDEASWHEFIDHPYYKLLMLNSEGMHEDFQQALPKNGEWVEFNFTCPMSKKDVLLRAAAKRNEPNRIISTSRWVPRKRVAELVGISDKLKEKGIETLVAGRGGGMITYFYSKDILQTNEGCWTDLGSFMPDDLPDLLKNAKYHYDFVFVKRQNRNRKMRGRLELVTIEALMHGCVPVLCDQSVPAWIGSKGKSAIVLPKEDLHKLPEIISEISDVDYLLRVGYFYDEVKEYIWNKYGDEIIPTFQRLANE